MSMRARFTTLSVAGALLLLAAPASAQHQGPGPFAGSFSVTSNTTVSVTSPITTTESRVTHERAEVRAGSRGDMAFYVTNERGERCVLEGNLAGPTSVTFFSGQRCAMTDPVRNMRMNLTLRSGSGSISGAHLSLRLSWGVATSLMGMDVSGTASQETGGNRTGGGPAIVAPPAPGPEPTVMAPTQGLGMPVQMGVPQAVPTYDLNPSTAAGRRGRRGRHDTGVVMTGAVPVVPSSAPVPVSNDAPIWALPNDGSSVPVAPAPMPMAPAPMPMAPAPMPMAPAPMPAAPTAPVANTPAPLWGSAAPVGGGSFGAPQPAPMFGAPMQGGLGAPQPVSTAGGPAPTFGTTPMVPTSALGAPSMPAPWGASQPGAAPAPSGTPLVSFGQPGGAPSMGAPPTYGTPQPSPYGYPQPGATPYGYPQPSPYGYPQPGAAPYGYPQPAAAPYGYPQPAPGPVPLVQFGAQRPTPAAGWGASAGAPAPRQPGVQPAPAPGAPRPLVMFSVTNGSF